VIQKPCYSHDDVEKEVPKPTVETMATPVL